MILRLPASFRPRGKKSPSPTTGSQEPTSLQIVQAFSTNLTLWHTNVKDREAYAVAMGISIEDFQSMLRGTRVPTLAQLEFIRAELVRHKTP